MSTSARSWQDAAGAASSSKIDDPLPVPSTSRTMLPRSASSSRGSSRTRQDRKTATYRAPDEGDDGLLQSHADVSGSEQDTRNSDPHQTKRRRITADEQGDADNGTGENHSHGDQSEEEEELGLVREELPGHSSSADLSSTSAVGPNTQISTWEMPPDISPVELLPLPSGESLRSTGETSGDIKPDRLQTPPMYSGDITIITPKKRRRSASSAGAIPDDLPLASTSATTTASSSSSATSTSASASASTSTSTSNPIQRPEPLAEYTCPICFSPPTNATLTPCGHICCGSCLFAAVKSTIRRNMVVAMDRAPQARCPVCRAEIPGWDGRGGGVVGLKLHVVYSL
ncbi:hypothetical protein F5I97DRAFT_1515139 [Phlebopus sp. FC_14]|nr:hypothetical protein F5I97DRAFT_1515139 [Phlebopus sp. FC_14]